VPSRAAAPYPYARWPKLSRVEARAASRLARIALHAEGSTGARIQDALTTAVGAEVNVVPWPACTLARAELAGALDTVDTRCVAIELAWRRSSRDLSVVLELTTELAGALVDRALGADGGFVRVARLPLDELELGALGYVAARACAASEGEWRVSKLTTSSNDLLAWLGEACVVWPLQVSVGELTGNARVWLDPAAVHAIALSAAPARRLDVPSALLGLPLQLCAHAATVRLTPSELSSLEPGDVVVPERTALARKDDCWYGQAVLHVLGRPRGYCALCEISERTLRIEHFSQQGEQRMSDDGKPEALVAEAPIELCVELARFTVRLEDVLGLRVGEVWSTGRAIGEHVVLTANGRAIARGELVEIEGDIGVRILEKHQ